MSIRIYPNIINQSKDIIDNDFGIIDETGVILACSNESETGHMVNTISDIIESEA